MCLHLKDTGVRIVFFAMAAKAPFILSITRGHYFGKTVGFYTIGSCTVHVQYRAKVVMVALAQ
jgi:hypothetical protein